MVFNWDRFLGPVLFDNIFFKDRFTSWTGMYFCQFQTLLAVVYSPIKTFIAVIELLISCLGAWQRSLSINMLE
jgi:hypothetical protein